MVTDDTLSVLVEALEEQEPDPSVRERLLSALRGRERWTPSASEVARVFSLSEEDARNALRGIEERTDWIPGPWPGSELLRVAELSRVAAIIARLPAGTRIKAHRHTMRELTYLLDGELRDGDQVYRSGELMDKPAGSEHALEINERCLVVFALL